MTTFYIVVKKARYDKSVDSKRMRNVYVEKPVDNRQVVFQDVVPYDQCVLFALFLKVIKWCCKCVQLTGINVLNNNDPNARRA